MIQILKKLQNSKTNFKNGGTLSKQCVLVKHEQSSDAAFLTQLQMLCHHMGVYQE